MRNRKKLIIGFVLAAVLVLGTIGGIALAADEGTASPVTQIMDRVAAILVGKGVNVTPEQLQDAFEQARGEIRDEALQKRLDRLQEADRITEEQATEYRAWLDSRPDMPAGPGFRFRPGFRGMGGMRGFGGPCFPGTTPTPTE